MAAIITAREAANLIPDNCTLVSEGFIGQVVAEEILEALEQRFIDTGKPENLTLMYGAAQGDQKRRGANHLAHAGLLRRAVGGHWGMAPSIGKLAMSGQIEGYNLPQGVISQMMREIAAQKPFYITRIGLNTFVDPRYEGGKLHARCTEDLVDVIEIDGEEYLKYKLGKVDFALLRGTTADTNGNISMEHECNSLEAYAIAAACRNSGGTVVVQVERLTQAGTLHPQMVRIPGVMVDYVVVASDPKYHMQTFGKQYDPAYCGAVKMPMDMIAPLPLDERKVIARRAYFELKSGSNVNLGIGLPEGVGAVASEQGTIGEYNFSVEAGAFGGMPLGGMSFGAAVNPEMIVDQPYMFDFYQGGGLDQTFLGLAQADAAGNINVSRFGDRMAGCGGFIDITQSTDVITFVGAMTAGALDVKVGGGKLTIVNEGTSKKFVRAVDQITFNGGYACKRGQKVKYVTERCVFELRERGLTLVEIAPGIELEKDVLAQMEFRPQIAENLVQMDKRIFTEGVMKL